jgi:hypothetical protein
MTSNSRRSSWMTRWPKDRPPRSTPCPQELGVLRSSCCPHGHRGRNHHVLWWCLPLLPPPPTTAAKARVRARGRGREKARTTALAAPATTAGPATPRRGPPSTIPGSAPSRCGQGCALLSNLCIHCSTPCLLHWCTTAPSVALPSCPYRRPHRTSSRSRPLPGCPRWVCGINSHWPTPSSLGP